MTTSASTATTVTVHVGSSRTEIPLPASGFTPTSSGSRRSSASSDFRAPEPISASEVATGSPRTVVATATVSTGEPASARDGIEQLGSLMRLSLPVADYMDLDELFELAGGHPDIDRAVAARLKVIVGGPEDPFSGEMAQRVFDTKGVLRKLTEQAARPDAPADINSRVASAVENLEQAREAFNNLPKENAERTLVDNEKKHAWLSVQSNYGGELQVDDITENLDSGRELTTTYKFTTADAVALAAYLDCEPSALVRTLVELDAPSVIRRSNIPYERQKFDWN